jgi:hypothetical protein
MVMVNEREWMMKNKKEDAFKTASTKGSLTSGSQPIWWLFYYEWVSQSVGRVVRSGSGHKGNISRVLI